MNKIYLKGVFTLILFAASLFSFQAKADAVVVGGVAYDVLEAGAKTAQVVKLPDDAKYTGTVTIAANVTIGGESYAVKKIGDSSLRDAPELTAVIIPEGLEIIGNSSFASNSGITELNFPSSVKSIEDWAFYGCSGLTSLVLPASVNHIGEWVFHNCTNLASVNIPDGVTAINAHTFHNAGITSLTLPASVTAIKAAAFQDTKNLVSLNLENIQEVGDWAFAGTVMKSAVFAKAQKIGGSAFRESEIQSVELTDTKEINAEAFRDSKIESFTLRLQNETEFVIKAWSFYNCKELKTVSLPETATAVTIEGCTFQACDKLESINFPQGLETIQAWTLSGCSALKTLTIPSSVNKIEDWSIEKTGLKTVIISWANPAGDVNIQDWAFDNSNFVWVVSTELANTYGTSWLNHSVFTLSVSGDIVVFNGVAYKILDEDAKTAEVVALPDGALYTGSITIAANVPFNGKNYAVKKIGNNSLRDAPELTGVIIPEGLEVIGNSSFASNTGITAITLPASVKSIEDWAFYGCSNLATINIPDGITAINEHTFQNSGLTAITLPASVTSLKVCAFQNASKLASINLENIREIVGYALYGTAITAVELTDVPVIDSEAFRNCPNLESFIWKKETATEFQIKGWTFTNDTKLKTVELPDGLTLIDGGAFSGCSALTTLTVPNSVKTIKDWSLEKTGLNTINVSWTNLEELSFEVNAFGSGSGKSNFVWAVANELADTYGNYWSGFPVLYNLGDRIKAGGVAYKILDAEAKTAEVVALPDGALYTGTITISANVPFDGEMHAVKKIGNNSLRASGDNKASEHLTEVIIPEGLEVIGNSAFASCDEITAIQLPASVNSIEDWAFYGCSNLATINIPNGITAINEHTFQNSGLTAIELPASVTSLKVCAFQDASKLASINLENITEIVSWALTGTAITSANLENVTALGGWSLSNCKELTAVTLSDNLTLIDGGTFSGCSVLDSLIIPNSVTQIKEWALEKTGLKRIYITWENPAALTINGNAFGSGDGVSNFVWMVTEELADVYGDIWLEHPVQVIGRTGIANIFAANVTWINENHAIRIIDGNNLNGTVDVYSINGVKVYSHSGLINNTRIELSAGVYVVRVASAAGVKTGKAIIK